MSETIPETQALLDLETILKAPVVTFLARVDEVRLGDVVDSLDGLVHVREIVHRRHRWDLAGDPPGHIRHDWRGVDEIPPLIRRGLLHTSTIRVRRSVTFFGRLKGHSKNVHSHAPVKRGWYTDPGGYDAECSCGFKAEAVYAHRQDAAWGWLEHKAVQLTEAAYADNSALKFLATAEDTHPLPPVPWTFKKISHGPRNGGGIAEADLDALTVDQAHHVLAAWRAVPGLDDVETFDTHRDGPVHSPWGNRPGHTSLHQSANGPDNSRFILGARIDDTAPTAAEEVAQ